MRRRGNRWAAGAFWAFLLVLAQRVGGASRSTPTRDAATQHPAVTDTAVFAGGCFWGIQSVFQHVRGVVTATSGYTGGWTDRPTYEQVSTGRTGHAEAVRIVFDPSRISYEKLLEVFFTVAHDPTQRNRQGPDVGTQYRSAVFYTSREQQRVAQTYIARLNNANVFKSPVVTEVTAFKEFFRAEAYHQGYAERHPRDPYIMMYDAPKVANLKRQFPALYVDQLAPHEQ